STGWKLILDSDMLFFETPTEILHWWDERRSEIEPCFMRDCEESYGYSRSLMTSLTGSPIPEELNVGICGLRSETIDWNELEHWCTELVEREGTSYFLEQALVAMIASRAPHRILPRESYITFPSSDEANAGAGVLQHYVADSKPDYFGTCWKIAAAS
ncbi:MAG: glycosyl transferase, partial [Verrucomicrobiota bacterium]